MNFNQQAVSATTPEQIAMEKVAIKQVSIVDQIGVVLSAVCLVHCILTPILLLALPLADAFIADEWFHRVMLAIVLPVASFAFVSGVRQHGNRRVLLLGLSGLAFIAFGTFGPEGLWGETLPTILGSLLLVAAHLINRRLCQKMCRVQNLSHCCYNEV